MTISEAILSFPGLEDTSANFLTKVLTVRSISGAGTYSDEVDTKVNLCAADLYAFVGNRPDFSENKLSETYPRSYYISTARSLYNANGEPEKASALNKIVVPRGKANSSW